MFGWLKDVTQQQSIMIMAIFIFIKIIIAGILGNLQEFLPRDSVKDVQKKQIYEKNFKNICMIINWIVMDYFTKAVPVVIVDTKVEEVIDDFFAEPHKLIPTFGETIQDPTRQGKTDTNLIAGIPLLKESYIDPQLHKNQLEEIRKEMEAFVLELYQRVTKTWREKRKQNIKQIPYKQSDENQEVMKKAKTISETVWNVISKKENDENV
eukprot:TRINITY_DN9805_c0_g4_i1.p1 TRINITY_DN9805_c0_g4~~TRINITY_DN9805_c0_g4_i1.p1  ORF type:complete len:209 (+),score=30.78 TRINITY_DN9805_c0_g4_i1:170-796(+)